MHHGRVSLVHQRAYKDLTAVIELHELVLAQVARNLNPIARFFERLAYRRMLPGLTLFNFAPWDTPGKNVAAKLKQNFVMMVKYDRTCADTRHVP